MAFYIGDNSGYANSNFGDFVIGLLVVGYQFYTSVYHFEYCEFTLRVYILISVLKILGVGA